MTTGKKRPDVAVMAKTRQILGNAAVMDRFCLEYMLDYNGRKAAQRANISQSYAYDLLDDPRVQQRLRELQQKQAKELQIDSVEVTRRFNEIYLRCIQAEPVLDHDGNETGEYVFDAPNALRANEKMVCVLASAQGDKVALVVGVSKDLTKTLNAVDIVKAASGVLGGGGGGRADLAQAGGAGAAKLGEAFEAARALLKDKLGG